jgi:hypothetical protein
VARGWSSLLTTVILLVSSSPLLAQADQQKKFLEDERRREMDERAQANADLHQDVLWDFGGWFHGEVTRMDDKPDRDHRTYRYGDLRLWGELVYDERYTAYVRLQSDVTDFNQGDQFSGDDNTIVHPVRVDQAYLDGNFSWEGTDLRARAGKDFESLGRGLLLNGVYYGGHVTCAEGPWAAKLLVAHTILHEADIDTSLPDERASKRGFIGVEGDWIFSADHRFYVMALVERDFNDAQTPTQKWDYNADYIGLGARGTVIENLSYAVEAVYEFGRSAAGGSTQSDPIEAFAATAGLDYLWRVDTSPVFVLEYMYGSGDKDRSSVTDAAAGNTPGTRDTGFLSFGFLQTGFSLFPKVSNIHILRVGGSFHPLESVDVFRYLELGAFYYYYRKARAAEPISDPRSFLDSANVGSEVDVQLRWRVLSDLGITVNYGVFMPGTAYQEKSNRTFISAGFSFAF